MRLSGRLVAAAFACLLAALSGEEALAHSTLLRTEPAAEAILDRAPDTVRLIFNEPVAPVAVRVLDRAGTTVTRPEDVSVKDKSLIVRLPSDLADGSYVVTWRVASADSHPIGGSFRFSIGAAGDGAAIHDSGAREAVWETLSILNRALFYGCLLAAAGGALFLLGFQRQDEATPVHGLRRLALVALVPTVLSLPIEGGRLLAAQISDFADPALWRTAAFSTVGRSLFVAALGLLFLLAGLQIRRRIVRPALIAAGAFVAIGSLALTGHAAAAAPRPFMSWTVFTHALAVAFWFGALHPLLSALRTQRPQAAADLLHRFSDVALVVVTLLIAAGASIAIVQVEAAEKLTETSYGRLFLLKLGLVATALLVALANRRRLTPRLASGDDRAKRALQRNIQLEIGIISVGLLVTATLGHVTPPRALIAAERSAGDAAVAQAHGHDRGSQHATYESDASALAWTATSRGFTAEITLTSDEAGPNTLTAAFRDASGRPLEPLEVEARLASPEKGVEAAKRRLEPHGRSWRVDTPDLALPGRWTIRIDALVSDFEKVMFESEVVLQ